MKIMEAEYQERNWASGQFFQFGKRPIGAHEL
jgi:hypothetical protein